MKKFKFRLQKVLELREETEESRKVEMQRVADDLRKLKDLHMELNSRRAAFDFGDSDVYHQLQGTFLAGLLSSLAQLDMKIEAKNQEFEAAKAQYFAAYRDAETLRKLKSKKLTAYNVMVQREEMKFMDEMATLRYGRKN